MITLKVLDGADRGQTFSEIETPMTIGREEGNTVQLNDERISRFHIKIQEDQDKLVLTDLESTNGTRVNGEDTHLRILRFGDVIALGRSVLLFGTSEQIIARLSDLKNDEGALADLENLDPEEVVRQIEASSNNFDLSWGDSKNLQSTLHIPVPPELPIGLSPGQAAQFSEILEFLHLRSRLLIQSVKMDEEEQRVTLDLAQWQGLLDVQSQLAEYLRKIGDPDLE